MTWNAALPLLILASSLLTGVLIFALPEERHVGRNLLNVGGASVKLALVALLIWQTVRGREFEARLPVLPGFDLVFRADFLSLVFIALSAILWFLTTIYAIGYLAGSPHQSRFFGFFSFCVTATMGIALSGNLLTFVVFYELLTVTTFPLVVHEGSGESLAAGRTYLLYTLTGGVLLLAGTAWLHQVAGPVEFAAGGALAGMAPDPRAAQIFLLLIAGLGVKAALVPLHGWLPKAMVAPAPVSALLHAVAVVKAGVYGIIRVVHSVFGVEMAESLGVLGPLAALASVTIIYGSLRALAQNNLKRMLAYSTVSQLSYIVLGTALAGPLAAVGAIAHLLHQGIMKVTLFFCAGVLAKSAKVEEISELGGIGRRMPLTMAAFTIAALGMVGLPPTAGFVTKWYLGLGGLAAGQPWVLAVLVASGILNALYFLPVLRRAWFDPPAREWPAGDSPLETRSSMLLPTVATALLSAAVGVLAALPLSPLDLATRAVLDMYPP